VALAAVVATPALAQTASRRGQVQPGEAQYNESYGRTDGQRHSAVPSNDVYENGHYVGSIRPERPPIGVTTIRATDPDATMTRAPGERPGLPYALRVRSIYGVMACRARATISLGVA
jgi:hypothetical protein